MTFEVDIKTPMHKSLVFTAEQADLFDESSERNVGFGPFWTFKPCTGSYLFN